MGKLKNEKQLKQYFIDLYNEGKTDSEIGRDLNVANTTIRSWRIKMNLPKNSRSKIDKERFLELYNKKLNYVEIAKKMNISKSYAQAFGQKLGLEPQQWQYDLTPLSSVEIQAILGGFLGDSHYGIPKDCINCKGHFAHSIKQKNYCIWKSKLLSRMCSIPKESIWYDKRSNIKYPIIDCHFKASPLLTNLYPKMYHNKKKYICKEFISQLDTLGLAIWFMDDGYKYSNSFGIATQAFDIMGLQILQEILLQNFDLHFNIKQNRTLYLQAKDKSKFINLIAPYIQNDCLYKIGEP